MKCPRCSGTGFVDYDDIKRLDMIGQWILGPCKYCDATGEVEKGLPKIKMVNDPTDTWEFEFEKL